MTHSRTRMFALQVLVYSAILPAERIVSDSFEIKEDGSGYRQGNVINQDPRSSGKGWGGKWESGGEPSISLQIDPHERKTYTDQKGQAFKRAQANPEAGHLVVKGMTGGGYAFRSLETPVEKGSFTYSFLHKGNGKGSYAIGFRSPKEKWVYMLNNDGPGGKITLMYDRKKTHETDVEWTTHTGNNKMMLIVGRVRGIGTEEGTWEVWINPEDLSNLEDLPPDAVMPVPGVAMGIRDFFLNYNGQSQNSRIDELRMGRRLEDVVK